MPHPRKRSLPKRQPIEAVLRAALLRQGVVIPVTPKEVAAFDARHCEGLPPIQPPRAPSSRFSWETGDPATGTVVAFSDIPVGPLAYAARAGGAVSPETQAKLRELVREMKHEGEIPRG
jgi:hypothetical protein